MEIELWLAFIVAYSLISILPGPSVFMVVGLALSRGTQAAFLCILGDLLAGVVLISLSLFGVSTILLASASLFQLVKWGGVFYMAFLGFTQIRAASNPIPEFAKPSASAAGNIGAGFITGVLNPKAIIFYMAFLSQFMSSERDVFVQFVVLVPTATTVVGIVLSGYAFTAVRARRVFQSDTARRRIGFTGGGLLVGGSVLIAAKG